MSTFIKHPTAEKNYGIDWRQFLGNLTIDTFTVVSSNEDLVVKTDPPPANSDGVIVFWLAEGTYGEDYDVECSIATDSVPPLKDSYSIHIRVR